MRILCIAMPRSGILSMQEALTIHGYPTYHFSSIFGNIQGADMWSEALNHKLGRPDGKKYGGKELDQLLEHVKAATDIPCVVSWQELLEAYPDAKVVLVDRDIERWEERLAGLLEGVVNPVVRYVCRYTDVHCNGSIIAGVGLKWIELPLDTTDLQPAKRNARDAYKRHYRHVEEAVPEERLIEYGMGHVWESPH